jgi:flagellar basal body P-ring formation protein FlgA
MKKKFLPKLVRAAALGTLATLGTLYTLSPAYGQDDLLAAGELSRYVTVKNDARADGLYITLGDIFHVSQDKANIKVTPSPAPGNRIAISATSLAQFVSRQGLYWENAMRLRQIMVTRNSVTITENEVNRAIKFAFVDRGYNDEMDIQFYNRKLAFHIPVDTAPQLDVETLTYDPATHRFEAEVRTPTDNGQSQLVKISGTTIPVQIIPVLQHPVSRGDILTADDFKTRRIPTRRIGANVVANLDEVLGMQTRRSLRIGEPVRTTDLKTPTLIEKGALVTMVFEAPGMKITNVGRALESGGSGDFINVINPKSKQTVMAQIVRKNRVSVSIGDIQLASIQ